MNDERQHNQENGARAGSGLPLEALLSTYLDDRESLNEEELGRVETLLASDAEARRIYADLQVLVQGLGRLEPVAAPRSYHLDARMIGAPEPVQMTATTAWYMRHAGAVRWATAAAALLFVFVLSADLVLNGIFNDPSSGSDDASSMPATQSQMSGEALEESAPADADGAADDADGAAEAPTAAEGEAEDAADTMALPPDEAAEEEEESTGAGAAQESESVEQEPEDGSARDSTPEPVPTAGIAMDEEAAATPGENASVPEDTARSSDDEAQADTFSFNEEATAAGDENSDRRLWRIAEFSLVVILALLITAMIILPRLARPPTRR